MTLDWWRKRRDRSQVRWAAMVAYQAGELSRVPAGKITGADLWDQFPFLANFERLRREYVKRWGEEP